MDRLISPGRATFSLIYTDILPVEHNGAAETNWLSHLKVRLSLFGENIYISEKLR